MIPVSLLAAPAATSKPRASGDDPLRREHGDLPVL